MVWLKQSTAATLKLGPFVDDTDGKTAETALTIDRADIRLSKNGGAFAQTHNAAGATHDENGYYGVPLDTTDTNTLGRLRVAVSKTGVLPVWKDFLVLPASVFDSLVSNGLADIADAILARGVANVEAAVKAAGTEHCLATLILAALESVVSGTTWTIRQTDGETLQFAKTVTVDEDASPITGVS